jgi:hypothetical protein
LFSILFATHGCNVERMGVLAALYLALWGRGQFATGTVSDR